MCFPLSPSCALFNTNEKCAEEKAGIIHQPHSAGSRGWEVPARKTCAEIIIFFFSAALNVVLEEFLSEFLPGITPQLQAALPSPSLDTPRFSFSHPPPQLPSD